MVPRIILNICNDITQKYGNIIVQDLRKYKKPKYKQDKLELNIDFLNDCILVGVFRKTTLNYQTSQNMILNQYEQEFFTALLTNTTDYFSIPRKN